MKKFKKIFMLCVTLSLMILIVGSCGSNSGDSSNDNVNDEIQEIYRLYINSGGTSSYEEWLASVKGDKGETGNGISKIEKTSSEGLVDIYTITFTNGTTTTFTITNGKDGVNGSVSSGTFGLDYYPLDDGTLGVKVGKAQYLSIIEIPTYYQGIKVTKILDHAFEGCSTLTSIKIPSSITSIGSSAFYNCSGLTSIAIPSSVTSIGSYAFHNCYRLVEIYNLSSLNITKGSSDNGYIGYYARAIHTSLDEESNIIRKDDYIFVYNDTNYYLLGYEGTATELVLPESINGNSYQINSGAFYDIDICSLVTEIEIPSSVTSIGNYAFFECRSLTSVYYNGTIEDWCKIGFSDNYSNPISYASNFYLLDEKGTIEYNGKNYSLVTEIEIPNTITSIGNYQFYGFSNITSISIPSSVTSIGSSAFYNCSSLTSIIIPSSVTSIGSSAFYNCSSLTSIIIPSSVTRIGSSAFYNCSSLTSIIIPEGVTSIGRSAFRGCSSLVSIEIPSSVTSINYDAFYGCSKLTSVYYAGTSSDWSNIIIDSYNSNLTNATIYYYSETEPTEAGNYWHYVNDEIVEW